MTSAERPEADILEQRRAVVDPEDGYEPAEPDAAVELEVDAADAVEQRRPAAEPGDDEDYAPG